MTLEKTIYIGTFIQCDTLTELDIIPNGMIGVNEQGKIAFVLRSYKGRRYPDGEGWEEAKIVRIQDHGFFFPGFIGQSHKSDHRVSQLTFGLVVKTPTSTPPNTRTQVSSANAPS